MGETPRTETFENFDAMKEGLADILGSEVHLFVFQGLQHQISEGPWHYLLTSGGEQCRLFDVPAAADAVPAEQGYVGTLEDEEVPDEEPTVIKTVLQPKDDDDETSEEGGEEDSNNDPYGDEPTDLQIHEPT